MDKNISFFSVLKNGYKDQPKKRLGKYIIDEQLLLRLHTGTE